MEGEISFLDGFFSGAMLVSGSVISCVCSTSQAHDETLSSKSIRDDHVAESQSQ